MTDTDLCILERKPKMVTIIRRKKVLAKRRAQQRLAIKDNLRRQAMAWVNFAQSTHSQYANNISSTTFSTVLRFAVHSTHRAVECRGYVGCLTCGSIAMLPKEGLRLAAKCIPKVNKTSGSFYRVRRIAQGLHPYGKVDDPWPNGVVQPTPRRVSFPRPSLAEQRALRRWRWLGLKALAQVTKESPIEPPRKKRYTITKVSSTTWVTRFANPLESIQRGETLGLDQHADYG